MLDVPKRLNEPGKKEDILFFLKIIGKRSLMEKDLRIICSHAPGQYQLDVDSMLVYCSWLDLINFNETIKLSQGIVKHLKNLTELNDFIIKRTITVLFQRKIFNVDMFLYDIIKQRFIFKNERLPLTFAWLRNTLASQGFFEINRDDNLTEFYINSHYEEYISSFCKRSKRTIGIEQLKKRLKENELAGEKAEQYALSFERKRVINSSLVERIRIISDIDVCAGYDIVSFNSKDSIDYDRFIEVKAISGNKAFFWTKNELCTAKLKGERYFLYLIDLQRISDENYIPLIIKNPANIIFTSEEWLVEPQTYHICHV